MQNPVFALTESDYYRQVAQYPLNCS